jgi:CPA2 family monovalent cation:H+ antiporter-2
VARGEFSIVIAGLAVTSGIDSDLGPLATAYVLILVVLGPLTARYTEPLALRLTGSLGRTRPAREPEAGPGAEPRAEAGPGAEAGPEGEPGPGAEAQAGGGPEPVAPDQETPVSRP